MIVDHKPIIATIFGIGAVAQLGERVRALGRKRPICIYDSGIRNAGIADKAVASLKCAGMDYCVFGSVTPDPPSDLIDNIVATAKAVGADCAIGVGGGSSMDAAKATAIMMGLEGRMQDYLTPRPRVLKASVPIVLVPTTSGSGSEASSACVITHEQLGTKIPLLVESTLAIIDPELARTLPAQATAETGMDALSHAIEAITSKDANPRAEVLGLGAIERIARNLPIACEDGSNLDARTAMAYASNWAGLTTTDASLYVGHCIADAFTRAFPLPHGLPCAWATPEVISLVAPVVPSKVKLIGEAMGLRFSESDTPAEIGAKTAEGVRKLMKTISIRSPAALRLDRGRVLAMSTAVLDLGLRLRCPVDITPVLAARLMARAYDNYS